MKTNRVALLCLVWLGAQVLGATDISRPGHADEEGFYVAGYSVRTSNADELSGRGRIGPLWQRFVREGLATTIPNRVDQRLIAVYSEYSTDENGEFSYLLGARVSSIQDLPAGMSYRRIPAGSYAVFATRTGRFADVVPEAWKSIWLLSPTDLGGRRAFSTDYEVYQPAGLETGQGQVEIHIGVKREQ